MHIHEKHNMPFWHKSRMHDTQAQRDLDCGCFPDDEDIFFQHLLNVIGMAYNLEPV